MRYMLDTNWEQETIKSVSTASGWEYSTTPRRVTKEKRYAREEAGASQRKENGSITKKHNYYGRKKIQKQIRTDGMGGSAERMGTTDRRGYCCPWWCRKNDNQLRLEHYETYAKLRINEAQEHYDPSDHLIISHAITNRIPLISADGKFPFYRNQGLELIENKKWWPRKAEKRRTSSFISNDPKRE